MNSIAVLLLPPILLVPMMGILSRFDGSTDLTRELRRKTLHIVVGLTALSFQSLFQQAWMIAAGLGLIVGWMTAVRCIAPLRERFGTCLHDAGRESHGEMYFALALAFLLLVAEGAPHYVIPVLILTFADAAAAIAGRAFPIGRIGGLAGDKTQSGCVAFFAVAWLITATSLIVMTPMTAGEACATAAVVAATTCSLESVSHRGIDNLVVPVAAYFVLVAMGI